MILTKEHLQYMNLGSRYWNSSRDTLSERQLMLTKDYFDNLDDYLRKGIGLFLQGGNGTGKTYIASIICKLAWAKYRVSSYCVTTAELKESWIKDCPAHEDSKESMSERAESIRLLLLDDFGKEHRTTSGFTEVGFGTLIRKRTRDKKTTLITTNLTMEVLRSIYGQSTMELLKETSIPIWLNDENKRDTISKDLTVSIRSV